LGMAGGCATSCVTSVGMTQQSFDVPPALPQSHTTTALHWRAGPSYLPLTPPPIA